MNAEEFIAQTSRAKFFSDQVNRSSEYFTIRPREVHILKNAHTRFAGMAKVLRGNTFLVNDNYFSRLNIADKLGPDQVEGTRFRRKHIAIA